MCGGQEGRSRVIRSKIEEMGRETLDRETEAAEQMSK